MFCPKCGKELTEGKFCTGCGAQIEGDAMENSTMEESSGDSGMSFNKESVEAAADKMMSNVQNSLLGTSKNGINFMVRRYFFGFGDFMWISVIVWSVFSIFKVFYGGNYYSTNAFGGFCTFVKWVSAIVFVIAIVLNVYTRVIGLGKKKVDEATQQAINQMKTRAKEKFNVDTEQISEIDPIVVSGAGHLPSSHYVNVMNVAIGIGKTGGLKKLYSKDPVEGYRFGYDGVPRYLLIQTTYYAFTDTQLLIYSGNIDISTGVIYDESVTETFYSDINSVVQREVLKKFKVGLFKERYYTIKYLQLDVCGLQKSASFDTRFAKNANLSLAGMGSYIRERKNNV